VIDVTNFSAKTDFRFARKLASGGALDTNWTDIT